MLGLSPADTRSISPQMLGLSPADLADLRRYMLGKICRNWHDVPCNSFTKYFYQPGLNAAGRLNVGRTKVNAQHSLQKICVNLRDLRATFAPENLRKSARSAGNIRSRKSA